MKLKFNYIITATLALLCMSCTAEKVDDFFKKIIVAPPSHIERDVKGHDQIYAVHAILRMGYKGGTIGVGETGDDPVEAYNVYEVVSDSTSIPIRQEIDMSRNEDGEITITTQRDHFDVIASDKIYYGLELIYFDVNGKPINNQFSNYLFKKDANGNIIPDEDNSTLTVHQHFFGIGNTSLKLEPTVKKVGGARQLKMQKPTLQLAFPRTLSEHPVYYNKYTFKNEGGYGVKSDRFSPHNIYVPEGEEFKIDSREIPYNENLSWAAIERTGKKVALEPYEFEGKKYQLYRAIDYAKLNEYSPEIFTYEYRDTDPVDRNLGYFFDEHTNDDFIRPDGSARDRYSTTVGFLRQKRELSPTEYYDRLGFKGIMQFKKADIAFQLQVKICHILNKEEITPKKYVPAKYANKENTSNGSTWEFNQLQPAWDSFDIDYPISIRVIADTRTGKDNCIKDIKKFYPEVNGAEVERMLFNPTGFFRQYRGNLILM